MKAVRLIAALACAVVIAALFIIGPNTSWAAAPEAKIDHWQIMWIPDGEQPGVTPPAGGQWVEAEAGAPLLDLPEGIQGAWIRLQVPPTSEWQRPGLLVRRLYGLELAAFREGTLLFESKRSFDFHLNRLLLPLGAYDRSSTIDVRILTTGTRAGFITSARIGEFAPLEESYVRRELPDLLLGGSISFLALIMLICSSYLNRRQRSSWISLCLIALTIGTLISVYSPMLYIYYKSYANLFLSLFDLSMFVLFPALSYYVDEVLGGRFRFFTRFRKWQAGFSAFCFLAFIVYKATSERYYDLYYLLTNPILGSLILVQLIIIAVLSVVHAMRKNTDAIILSACLFLLALSGATDLVLYYASGKSYILFLWKIGVVLLIVGLVIILARRISADYRMLLSYSKRLELFNHRLERTEKLKIISDLAASVAHEVRNPLQVTRGFLQLLAGRGDNESKKHFNIAVSELDRASGIITDFLTFAKPELETVSPLNLAEELAQLEVIIAPHAAMYGGRLHINADPGLTVIGSSSKFKQALINLLKNSIEAFKEDGYIEINAYEEDGEAVIWIKDNGEGMDEAQIAKLGVPYFSTKSKGTGLGTMVTFRIIEVMKGTIDFKSRKGQGTEVLIRLPIASDAAREEAAVAAAGVLPNNFDV
ncbi:sensor histidine kinase [Cohnella hashimotonis]|uniref:histidine kinase n=1 Tax=Cohnella hashimotonis TaxID=2826895 RepID=A0ABT6TT72_9BACL|nr:HAMP domain-containing sensor histidine kinase [Cohnella hashimotonis]MDI4649919.1 HAMP domain-containing sensor histidine kinase [Cohnella hashimotonis]